MNKKGVTYYHWLIIYVILLAIVSAMGFFVTGYLGDMAKQGIINENESAISVLFVHLTDDLRRIEGAVKAMSDSPQIIPALIHRTDQNIAQANAVLDRYNSALEGSVSYLIDRRGTTIASSNRNEPDSFVGISYEFRPYFTQAIKGSPGRYFALGITSSKRGFYASFPVRNSQGKIIGVLAIKKDLDELEKNLSGYPYFFLLTPHGIIFLSGDKELLFKSMWPVDKDTQRKLIASRQFGDKQFDALLSHEVSDRTNINFRGGNYLILRKVINPEGWSIVLMAPTDRILIYKSIGMIVTVLICTFIIIPLIINIKTVRSAQLVRESEGKYRRFFSTSRDCVFITSKDGSWIDLNEAAVEIFGYSSREELMQVKIPDLYANPEERAKHLNIITEQGYTKEFPVELLRKDGTVIHTLITSVARYDAEGNVTGFQGTIRDITERRKAEEALLESELKFKSFAEYAIVGTYISQDGVLKYVNPKFAQMFGYKVEECLNNMPYETLVYPEDIDYVKEQVRRRTSGEIEFIHYSFRGMKKNGQVFPIEIYGSLSIQDGKPAAAGTLLDITDRKRAEEERLRLEKLQGVLEMAGTICHEMNQPMQIISGYSDMLSMNISENDPIKWKIDTIRKQIDRMAAITQRLMNIKNFETQDYAGFGRIININKGPDNNNE
ncbi:MAG: PAS domain S-box protein [Smithella sp.]